MQMEEIRHRKKYGVRKPAYALARLVLQATTLKAAASCRTPNQHWSYETTFLGQKTGN